MAKDDQEETVDRLLIATLTRTIDFLKYAEAKNAALLTFSSAWIWGLQSYRSDIEGSSTVRLSALVFFGAACLIALWSFLPKRKLPKFHRDPDQQKSLVYFGDIASFDPSSYKNRVLERYTPDVGHSAAKVYLSDIAIQIAVNSKIANRKFGLFNAGASAVFVGILLVITDRIFSSVADIAPLLQRLIVNVAHG